MLDTDERHDRPDLCEHAALEVDAVVAHFVAPRPVSQDGEGHADNDDEAAQDKWCVPREDVDDPVHGEHPAAEEGGSESGFEDPDGPHSGIEPLEVGVDGSAQRHALNLGVVADIPAGYDSITLSNASTSSALLNT